MARGSTHRQNSGQGDGSLQHAQHAHRTKGCWMLRAALTFAPRGALALAPRTRPPAPPLGELVGAVAAMSLWKSDRVREWVSVQKKEQFAPQKQESGRWWGPQLSRRKQARRVKDALLAGELTLEPTVMVPPPKFKGHKRERTAPVRAANIEQKMKDMPAMIAEHREKMRAARVKLRREMAFK